MSTMPAAVNTALGLIQCHEIPVPEPTLGKVLVKTNLASICGSDIHIVRMGWNVKQYPLPPGYPGHEGVGEVVDGGDTEFTPGDLVLTVPRIWNARAFAKYQIIDSRQLLRLSGAKPLSELLMAQQLGTVVFGCKRLPPLQGLTVLVIGQGSVGLFHDFMLRRLGARKIIAIEPIHKRMSAGKSFGIDVGVDVTGHLADEAVYDITGGEGADVVIEAVGTTETLNQAIRLARPWGTVVAFGLPDTMDPIPFDWHTFYLKSLKMHAVHSSQDQPGLPDFRQAIELIDRSEIDVSPLVTHQIPIQDIQLAFDLAHSKADGALKVTLTF